MSLPLLPILPNVLEILTLVVQNVPNCELKKRLKKPKISIRLIWNVVLKLLFNAPLTGLMSEIVYNILKIRWRYVLTLFLLGENQEESTDQIWYNSCMIQMIFNLSKPSIVYLFCLLPIDEPGSMGKVFKSKC